MIDPDLDIAGRIDALIDAELAEASRSADRITRRTARAFSQVRRVPREVTVNF